MTFTSKLLVSSAFVLSSITPALAQQTTVQNDPAPAGETAARVQAAPGEAEQDSGGLTEIIVTAQRRSQNLQDVPVAVASIGGEALGELGISDTKTLATVVPGMYVSQSAGNNVIFLRGVGTSIIKSENSIATYVDGVYMYAQFSSLQSMSNIERVEVLRGPQGTLFGRNATGGVVSYVTRDPGEAPQANASISYANYNTVEGSFYGSTPITGNLAADVSLYVKEQGKGWGRNLNTGEDINKSRSFAARSKIVWHPGEDTKVTATGIYSKMRSDNGLNYTFLPGSIGVDGVTTYGGFYNSAVNAPVKSDNRALAGSLKIEQDLGGAQLLSISAYQDNQQKLIFEQDGVPASNVDVLYNTQVKTFTQELQLQSPESSRVSWIVGAFYMWNEQKSDPIIVQGSGIGPFPVQYLVRAPTKSYAAFAQATAPVFENTNLTLGIRYSVDERRSFGRTFRNGVTIQARNQSNTLGKPTWRIALDHKFSDDVMGYVSYNRGFKSGAYGITQYTSPIVRPEVIDAYEVGLKSEIFDRAVRFNLAAFYYDFRDLHFSQIVTGAAEVRNASAAEIYGLDVDFEAHPVANLAITGGMELLRSKYTRFPGAPDYVPNVDGQGVATGGNRLVGIDASGNDTINAPKLTFFTTANYTIQTSSGDFNLLASLSHNSGYFWDVGNRLREPSYNIVNASIAWTDKTDAYTVRLFATNILDEKYSLSTINSTFGNHFNAAEPFTYGIGASVKF